MYSCEKFLSKKLYYSKDLYEQELKTRQQNSNKFPITITIYTAIIGAWVTLFKSVLKVVDTNILSLLELVLFLMLFATGGIIIVSIYFFIKCFFNYKERSIEPVQVNDLFINSKKAFDEYEEDEIINNIDDIMANSYMECAIHNFEQTNVKIQFLNRAYKYMIISLILLLSIFMISIFL